MRQTFSDRYWVEIDGKFTAQSITGDYTDSNGKTGTWSWNRADLAIKKLPPVWNGVFLVVSEITREFFW